MLEECPRCTCCGRPRIQQLHGTTVPVQDGTSTNCACRVVLHAIDAEGGEEPPLLVQVVEGQHLSLPRHPKKRAVSTFGEWVRCVCRGGWTHARHRIRDYRIAGNFRGAKFS